MDRNTIYGLILIAVIFIGFSFFNSNKAKKAFEKEITVADSLFQAGDYPAARTSYARALRYQRGNTHAISRITSIDSLLIPLQAQKQVTDTTPSAVEDIAAGQVTGAVTRVDTGNLAGRFGDFAGAATGEIQMITLENEKIRVKISTLGGRVYSVELKEFETWDKRRLVLFDGDSSYFGLNFFYRNRNIATNEMYFEAVTGTTDQKASADTAVVVLRLQAGQDRYIEHRYSLAPSSYMLDFDMRLVGMNELITNRTSYLDLRWETYIPQQERGAANENNYTTISFWHHQDEMDALTARGKSEGEEVIRNKLSWISFKQQFFSSVIIAEEPFLGATVRFMKLDENPRYLKKFTAEISLPYDNKAVEHLPMKFYFGPNHYGTLKKYDMGLEDLVELGGSFIRWINLYLIIPIFNFLNRFIANYGIIILLLTIIIKILLFPLTYRSYLSQAKMRILKPNIDEINARYPKKDDAMKKQQATMDLYKKAGVSPLGGCLPMLLQFPILFAMFRFFPTSIELRQEAFLWAKDLSTYDSILNLPFSIPMYGDHVSLFTLLMTASTILTMKLSDQSSMSSSTMPGMKGMMYIMPVMFMLILNNFSAALTYYYFLANIITFAQNWITKKYFVDDEAIMKKIEDNKKKAPQKSKFQARLEEMSRKRGVPARKK